LGFDDFISRSPLSSSEEKLSLAERLNTVRELAKHYFDDADEWYSRDEDLTDKIGIEAKNGDVQFLVKGM